MWSKTFSGINKISLRASARKTYCEASVSAELWGKKRHMVLNGQEVGLGFASCQRTAKGPRRNLPKCELTEATFSSSCFLNLLRRRRSFWVSRLRGRAQRSGFRFSHSFKEVPQINFSFQLTVAGRRQLCAGGGWSQLSCPWAELWGRQRKRGC